MTIQVSSASVRLATKLQALAALLLQFSHQHHHLRLGRHVISGRAVVNQKPRCDRRSRLFPLRRVSMHDGHKGDEADSDEREDDTPTLDMREHASGMIDVLDARGSEDRDETKEGTVIRLDFSDDESDGEGTVILEVSDDADDDEGADTEPDLKIIERLTQIIDVLKGGRSNRTADTTTKGVVVPETSENSSSIRLGGKNGRKMIKIRSGEGDEDSSGGADVLSKLLGARFGLAEDFEEEDEDTVYSDPIRNFDLKPKEIVDHLNRYVIQQDDAKKVLAVAISDHYNHCRRFIDTPVLEQPTNYAKPNILLVGPTGVGKTYLMKTIAKLIGVPFVKADATKFSETGIVGKDVDDLVRDLVDSAGGNVTAAQFGIVYIDEVDKIASGNNPDMSVRTSGIGHGVQNNLLKLLEDTDVSLVSDMRSQMSGLFSGDRSDEESINTRNILFIFSGAFTTLDAEIRRRKETKSMGFTFDKQSEEREQTASYLRFAETADFVSSGLEAEFVGRVPVRVALNALDEHDLKEILTNAEDNVLAQFVRDFEGHNITMLPTDDALTQVARLAAKEKTGARGLVTVLERVLREHKYELPSSSIKAFELDNATVVSPALSLEGILSSQTKDDILNTQRRDAKRWEQHTGHQVGGHIRPVLDDGAFEEFVNIAHEKNVSIYSAIVQQFQKISVRLPLYLTSHANRTNQTELLLDRNFVKHPEESLEALEKVVERELEKISVE